MNRTKYAYVIALSALLLGSLTTNVMAEDGKWEKHHPRRDQVNDRLETPIDFKSNRSNQLF